MDTLGGRAVNSLPSSPGEVATVAKTFLISTVAPPAPRAVFSWLADRLPRRNYEFLRGTGCGPGEETIWPVYYTCLGPVNFLPFATPIPFRRQINSTHPLPPFVQDGRVNCLSPLPQAEAVANHFVKFFFFAIAMEIKLELLAGGWEVGFLV